MLPLKPASKVSGITNFKWNIILMPNKLRTIELLKNFAPKLLELEMYYQLKNKLTSTITKPTTNIV